MIKEVLVNIKETYFLGFFPILVTRPIKILLLNIKILFLYRLLKGQYRILCDYNKNIYLAWLFEYLSRIRPAPPTHLQPAGSYALEFMYTYTVKFLIPYHHLVYFTLNIGRELWNGLYQIETLWYSQIWFQHVYKIDWILFDVENLQETIN